MGSPLRSNIPIWVAAIGPKNVQLTAELAEGWQPILFHPGRAAEVFGPSLDRGGQKRDPALGPIDIAVQSVVAIGPDVHHHRDQVRQELALYIGGMGAPGTNYYNELAGRYGYPEAAARIQELYLGGRRDEAIAAVPDELIDATSLIGSRDEVADRLAALRAAGVTTLIAKPVGPEVTDRIRVIEQLRELST